MSNKKYQVWAIDQYNYFEILTVLSSKGVPENQWESPEEAALACKRFVLDKNRNNPLTFDEQQREWTHAYVELNEGKDCYYSGNLIQAKRTMLVKTKDGFNEVVLDKSVPVRFYLGDNPSGEDWYLMDRKKEFISDFEAYELDSKILVFIHPE